MVRALMVVAVFLIGLLVGSTVWMRPSAPPPSASSSPSAASAPPADPPTTLAPTPLPAAAAASAPAVPSSPAPVPAMPTAPAERRTIRGTFTLISLRGVALLGELDGRRCAGMKGYDDIRQGAQVQVTDERDAVIGVGQLSAGHFPPGVELPYACQFTFEVGDLPTARFYGIAVGRQSRGKLQHSFEDLEASRWTVALSLGRAE